MAQLIATNQLTLTNVNDGQTPYVHWAYSDNADGTGLTTSDNGQRYIGHYSDYTQADSTDKTKYRWADRWAKIEVGGVNLLTGTRDWSSNIQRWANNNRIWNDEAEDYNNLKVKSTTFGWNGWHQNIFVKAGEYYTLSYYAKADRNINLKNSLVWDKSPIFQGPVAKFDGSNNISDNIATEWKRYSRTVKITGDGSLQWRIEYDGNALPNGKWYIAGMKLERGTVATDWSPAPEDIQADIASKADQALTEQQLNLLTEKAQQMQVELEARATMEALSDLERAYNAYVKANDQSVAKSENDLIETARRVDAIVETLGGLKKTKTFIDTYITEANEGIIIGTNDNVSQIRVTHDRIAMYSAGKEVMYISQGVIHIDNGVFTKSLQIGRFITSQHESNPDINICRYVG